MEIWQELDNEIEAIAFKEGKLGSQAGISDWRPYRSVFTIRRVSKRIAVLAVVMSLLFALLAYRFYSLQILQGQQYRDAFLDQIERTENTAGIRGNIYDRNGRLLAYNERTWQVSIEDNGIYTDQEERNRELNRVLAGVVEILEKNGDDIEMYFPMEMQEDGTLTYTWDGSRRLRFLADVYGHSSAEELAWRERDGYDERGYLRAGAFLSGLGKHVWNRGRVYAPAGMAGGIPAVCHESESLSEVFRHCNCGRNQ